MGRLLNILDYSLYSLKRKILKNLAVALILSVVVFLFGSFQLFTRALTDLAEQLLQSAPDITIQGMSAGRQVSVPIELGRGIDKIYGLRSVTPRIWGYYFDESNGANYTVIGLDNGLEGVGKDRGEKGDVAISEKVADLLQLDQRTRFSLFKPDLTQKSFRVVHRYSENKDVVTADLMVMSLSDARDLFAIEQGFVTDFLVDVVNPLEINTVARKISEILPGTRVTTKKQILKTYKVVFNWRSGFGMICLLTSILAFGILAWDKASGLSREDVKEIAVLKLVGWQTSDILVLRFAESLVVSIVAFTFGYLCSWVHIGFFDGVLFKPILLGWSVLQPSFILYPSFAGSDLVLVFTVSVVPFLVATSVPGWRSAAVRADSVI